MTATHDINELKRRMHGATGVLKTELSGLRTGRASAHCSIPSWWTPTARRCRSTRSRPSACRSRGSSRVKVWDKSLVHRGREGDRQFQSRPVTGDRRPGHPPAHSGAERGAAQGTREGRAQICRGRAGCRAPCAPRRPRCGQEAGEGPQRSARTITTDSRPRSRRRRMPASLKSINCSGRRKRRSSPSEVA